MGRITKVLPDAAGVVRTVEVEVGGIKSTRYITFSVPLELDCGGEAAITPRENTTVGGRRCRQFSCGWQP